MQDAHLASINVYVQQARVEPINIHHEYYATKIQQHADDWVSLIRNRSAEQRLPMMNALSRTVNHLKAYSQVLDEQSKSVETKLQRLGEQVTNAQGYSMVDSLVRELIEDLTRQQNAHRRQQTALGGMVSVVHSVRDQLEPWLIPNLARDQRLTQQGLYET